MRIDYKSMPSLIEAVRYVLESYGTWRPVLSDDIPSDFEDRMAVLQMTFEAAIGVIDDEKPSHRW